jgi:hypothetical protein
MKLVEIILLNTFFTENGIRKMCIPCAILSIAAEFCEKCTRGLSARSTDSLKGTQRYFNRYLV